MSAQHTPGPWQARGSHKCDDFGIVVQNDAAEGGWMVVAECFSDLRRSGERAVEEAAANARLIAAAPDLLDALERLSAQCDRLRMPGQPMSDAEKNAHAAIAKATGQKGGA